MKKQLVALSVALALSLTLGSAGVQAKTFTWTAVADALSMDPYSTNHSFTNSFMNNLYEGLVRFNEKIQIEPALAESWTAVSPTVWRFKLRHNVKFHSGELIDIEYHRVHLQNYFSVARFGASYYIRTCDRFAMGPEKGAPKFNPIDEL